jgi:putative flippase GtrA
MFGSKASPIRTLFITKTDRTEIQLLRSAAAAHLGFWVDFAALALLTEIFGLHYLASAAFSFTIGLSVTYGLSVLWIFKHHRIKSRIAEFAAFGLIGVIGAVVMLAAMWFLTELVHLHYLISKIISSVLVFAVNFTMRKLLLFRSQRPETGWKRTSQSSFRL